MSAAGSNAEVRAAVLARVDERLHEMFPDGRPAAAVSSFDDLEAAAAVTGDAVARELMEQAIRSVLALPDASPPERCPTCGTKLKHVEMPQGGRHHQGPRRREPRVVPLPDARRRTKVGR